MAVHLDDVHLHPHTGEPMPRPQPAVALGQQDQGEEGKEEEAAAAAARRAAAAAAVAAARELHVDAGLPQVGGAGERKGPWPCGTEIKICEANGDTYDAPWIGTREVGPGLTLGWGCCLRRPTEVVRWICCVFTA